MCKVLNAAGTVPDDNEELTISVINGNNTSRESLSNHVGMGSMLHDLVALSQITLRTVFRITGSNFVKLW